MGSKWRKARVALSCINVPSTVEGGSLEPSVVVGGRPSDSALVSPAPTGATAASSDSSVLVSATPTSSPSGLRSLSSSSSSSSRHGSKSSKGTCAICLATMKPGKGHAIFTAECSHSFHFHCITSNVKHGNQICPVCRAKWKEIPFQTGSLAQDDAGVDVTRQLPTPRQDPTISSFFHAVEPNVFDDDERVDHQPEIAEKGSLSNDNADEPPIEAINVKAYSEVSAVSRLASHDNFTILIHLKALTSRRLNRGGVNEANMTPTSQNSRAPVDLITVLDISGSMAGTKLALLKRAMGFVIHHLGPSDRLSVIAFSSTARRLFPLRRMTDTGRQEVLHAINALSSHGGTNIAAGLRKGAKVLTDRQQKNPVASVILLSDGQDTYTAPTSNGPGPSSQRDYRLLLPSDLNIPVHAFGFGADHDAAAMHSIAESSGGTFSFVEAESVIQDAFAQCIGGLLSVVVQQLQVEFECVHPSLKIGSIKAGNYNTTLTPDLRLGSIDFGDLYAEEERDFLTTVNIPPADISCNEMSLLKVRCVYSDPITNESVTLDTANELKIERPEITGDLVTSVEVDRQRNRLMTTGAMEEARAAAENGDLATAVSVLEHCREVLSTTVSFQAGDQLCAALAAELREVQERMANHRVYESSGRAYVLSGLSSHLWQRATARGDSTDSTSLVQSYQTPTMTDMVTHSQIFSFGGGSSPQPPPSLRPPQPR